MQLLQEKELIWSPVVANCNMNRKRNLSGVNSYEKDIGLDIIGFLKKRINENEKVNWMDLCCGEGKAVVQAGQLFRELKMESGIEIEGLDLTDHFIENNSDVKLITNSTDNWMPYKKYDLITCVHGLHYVGNKLLAMEKIFNSLKTDGQFIGNVDLDNIKNEKGVSMKNDLMEILKEKQIDYNSRKRILICKGRRNVQFGFAYLGADDKAGKNYTGQEVVNSFYEIK